MSVTKLNAQSFDQEVLHSNKPVVEEIAGESDAYRVCKINVDDAPEIAARYRVMSIPTLIVFQGGEAAARTVGVQSKQTILNMLK